LITLYDEQIEFRLLAYFSVVMEPAKKRSHSQVWEHFKLISP